MDHRHALPNGFELHEFRIEETLGAGGFGIVYAATDQSLDAPVVIKEYLPNELAVREGQSTVYPKSSADTETYRWGLERFMEEARTLARFRHPNIVRISRVFQANQTAYMVMDDEGRRSLEQYLDRYGRLNAVQIEALLYPLLDALETIHAADILHRDIKPANILIRDDNSPVLIDFGAARQSIAGRTQSLTSIVSPGYAPPEQYDSDGHEQGAWSDLYALGALLYRCVSGERPAEATSRLLNDRLTPAIEVARGEYPAALLKMIDHCLAPRPDARPGTVAALRTALSAEGREEKGVEPSGQTEAEEKERSLRGVVNKGAKRQFAWTWLAVVLFLMILLLGFGSRDVQQKRIEWQESEQEWEAKFEQERIAALERERIEQERIAALERERLEAERERQRREALAGEFVRIPSGCFQMGSPASEEGRDDDEHQHRVCVEAFALAKYEVTNAQYRRFKPEHDSGDWEGHSLNDDDQPVVEVSWNDALAYAEWLSRESGQRYRLPTEAEWEYAARAGTATARYWGDDPDQACRYANVADQTAKRQWSDWTIHNCDDGYAVTAPVGHFQANAYGLHDMLGNVWEWTCSTYESAYGGSEKRCESNNRASGPLASRGGSWISEPFRVRSAYRLFRDAEDRTIGVGFRLAQD